MIRASWVLLTLLASAGVALARGGGCVEEGTLILTPGGLVPIERLSAGDSVVGPGGGAVAIRAVMRAEPAEYVAIAVGERSLHLTSEHPVQISSGEFRTAGTLRGGDYVCAWEGERVQRRTIRAVSRVPAEKPAWNLLVDGGRYIAGGMIVHNKGCFLPDTPILLADGREIQISQVRPGDEVRAFEPDGKVVRASVRQIITHEVDEYLVVTTPKAVLHVTKEHPFYVGDGRFLTLESLHVGERIFIFNGTSLESEPILGIERLAKKVRVYNLQTAWPHTFFAAHVAVHNKGGCFPAGTVIATAQGEIAIERLKAGDEVLGVGADGQMIRTRILATHIARSALLVVQTDRGALRTTPEHPVRMYDDRFCLAEDVRAGDRIAAIQSGRVEAATVISVELLAGDVTVHNLTVASPHTFIAAGFVVHNKGGGCFPAGTAIRTANGETAIEWLRIGDTILAAEAEGRLIPTSVEGLIVTRAPLLVVSTDRGELRTTDTHPIRMMDGSYRAAGLLRMGDRITFANGQGVVAARVVSTHATEDEVEVYNLSVSDPHTFIADGFVVHNKGGGGFHGGGHYYGGRSSGSGSGDSEKTPWWAPLLVGGMLIGLIYGTVRLHRACQADRGDDGDEIFTDAADAYAKIARTERLAKGIAANDVAMLPDRLRALARTTFLELQRCWQARNYEPMRRLMAAPLWVEHHAKIQEMIRKNEINLIEQLRVDEIRLVHIRYTRDPDSRQFTMLISATARDYYVNDRTRRIIRGQLKPCPFEEFWVFQMRGGRWLLARIDQVQDSNALKAANVAEGYPVDELERSGSLRAV